MIKTKEQLEEIKKLNELGRQIEEYTLATLTGRNWLCNLEMHKQVYTHDATVGYYYWASICQRCGKWEDKHNHGIFSVPPLKKFEPIKDNLDYIEQLAKERKLI